LLSFGSCPLEHPPAEEVPAGDTDFIMGDGTWGPDKLQTISYQFYMSKYEITNAQFAQFVSDGGYTTESYWTTNGWTYKEDFLWSDVPYYWSDPKLNGPNKPVAVSWYEAVAYCNWRSDREGLTRAYDNSGDINFSATGYRLPTEVEWEYMAVKGARGQEERLYPWGNSADSSRTVCNTSEPLDVGSKSASGGDTPQGLSDMCGNDWEWCSDNYQDDPEIMSKTNRYYFIDDSPGSEFVVRGNAWPNPFTVNFQSAYRNISYQPSTRWYDVGFRLVHILF